MNKNKVDRPQYEQKNEFKKKKQNGKGREKETLNNKNGFLVFCETNPQKA